MIRRQSLVRDRKRLFLGQLPLVIGSMCGESAEHHSEDERENAEHRPNENKISVSPPEARLTCGQRV